MTAPACESTPSADKNACHIAADVVSQVEVLPATASSEDRKRIFDDGQALLRKPLPKIQSVAIRQLASTTVAQRNTGADQDKKIWVELNEACKVRGHS